MKIFGLLGALAKVYKGLNSENALGRKIDSARRDNQLKLEQKYIYEATRSWSNYLVNEFDIHLKVVNPEKLPEKGPVLYVSNHQSYLDIVVLLSILKHQAGFVAKDALKHVPSLNRWILRTRCIYIERGNTRDALRTINLAVSYLNDGFSMVVFPEGTRSRGGEPSRFKPGAFKFATKAGVPIVPITINGTHKVYEGRGELSKGEDVEIIIHDMVETKGLDRKELLKISDNVAQVILKDLVIEEEYNEKKKLLV